MSHSNAAVENELSRMEAYPERHKPMTKERAQSTEQARPAGSADRQTSHQRVIGEGDRDRLGRDG